jgi:hypothetical protein
VVTGMVDHVLQLAASAQQLDHRAGNAWTLRRLAFHAAESAFYAAAVGALRQ